MSKVNAVLDQIEAEQPQQVGPVIPKGVTAPELADMVMRGEVKLSPQQMRAMVELLPFHAPKLASVAVGYIDAQDFASRLERAVNRSEKVRLIEGRAIEVREE